MKTSTLGRHLGTVAAVSLSAVAIAACGGSSNNSSSSSSATGTNSAGSAATGADAAVAAKVPAAVKSKGTLVVAADATYPPNEFMGPGNKVEGMDPDLAAALAATMGLKADVKNATFDSIIPGLAAKKYDLGMSSFTDTKEREKTVDFVTYFNAGTSFYTKAQGGTTVNTLADLCGKTVAVEKGTTQQTDAQAQSKKCGAKKVNVLTFPDQNGANLAISSGRAQLGMADSPVADYQVKQSNAQFKNVGQPYGEAPYGIAVPKDSGLAPAVQAALEKLIADGQYMTLLKKWGVDHGAITKPVINGATS